MWYYSVNAHLLHVRSHLIWVIIQWLQERKTLTLIDILGQQFILRFSASSKIELFCVASRIFSLVWSSVSSWLGLMFSLVLQGFPFVVLRQSHEEVLLHVFKMTSSASLSLSVKGAAPFTSKRLGLVACTVYLCVSLCDEVITAFGPSKSVGLFIIHSSHTPVLWPGPGRLWFPQSEATVALICSGKLYHASKVNG